MPPRRSPSAETAARCRLGRIVARTERPRRAFVAAIRRCRTAAPRSAARRAGRCRRARGRSPGRSPPAACPRSRRRSARCRAGGRRRPAPRRAAATARIVRFTRSPGRRPGSRRYGRQRTPTRSPTRVTGSAMRPRSVPNSFVCTATAIRTLPALLLADLADGDLAHGRVARRPRGSRRRSGGRSTSSARRRRARGTWPRACAAPTRCAKRTAVSRSSACCCERSCST